MNVVRPGAIATDVNGGLVRDDPRYHAAVSSAIALGRPGEADGTVIELSGGQRL